MKGTEMYELSGRAEGVDWSDVAMAGRAYADNIVGEPAVTAAMHSMADEIERLRLTEQERKAIGVAIQCVEAAMAQRHPEEEDARDLLHKTSCTLSRLFDRMSL